MPSLANSCRLGGVFPSSENLIFACDQYNVVNTRDSRTPKHDANKVVKICRWDSDLKKKCKEETRPFQSECQYVVRSFCRGAIERGPLTDEHDAAYWDIVCGSHWAITAFSAHTCPHKLETVERCRQHPVVPSVSAALLRHLQIEPQPRGKTVLGLLSAPAGGVGGEMSASKIQRIAKSTKEAYHGSEEDQFNKTVARLGCIKNNDTDSYVSLLVSPRAGEFYNEDAVSPTLYLTENNSSHG